MDDATRRRYMVQVTEEMKRNRPQDSHLTDAIVNHLFAMPQMREERDVLTFIDEYRKAVKRGVGNGVQ